jgi:hypothetical protein
MPDEKGKAVRGLEGVQTDLVRQRSYCFRNAEGERFFFKAALSTSHPAT